MEDLLSKAFDQTSPPPELRPVTPRTDPREGLGTWDVLKRWYLAPRPSFELISDWKFKVDEDTELIVPKGFVVNGASVPRFFWFMMSPVGVLFLPSIIHDYAYVKGKVLVLQSNEYRWITGKSRTYYDRLFLKVAQSVNPWSWKSRVAYYALVFGGQSAWDKYRSNTNA